MGGLFELGGGEVGGAYLIQKRRWYQFSIKKGEYKVEKLKYNKVGGQAVEDRNQIQTSSW